MWYTMVTLNPMVLVGTMLGSWYLVNMQLSTNAMVFSPFRVVILAIRASLN